MPKADRLVAGLAVALLAVSLVGCSGGGGNVVTVNGTPITKAQLDNELESSPAALGTLQNMVRSELLKQYAQKNNITVSDADIQKREDEIKQNLGITSDQAWQEMLKARGLSEKKVHDALKEQIIVDDALGKDIHISDAQIKQYFDKNHAAFDKPEQIRVRHILVADEKTAKKVEADLKSGKSWTSEAEQYSIDPGSKDKGGELGWVHHGQMVPTFDAAAFSLPVGKISDPVKSPFGYHIIQVEEKQPAVKATLANTRDKIAETLRQQQEAPLMQPFFQDLQAKANIQVTDPQFAAAFPTPVPTPSTAPAATAAAPAASSSP